MNDSACADQRRVRRTILEPGDARSLVLLVLLALASCLPLLLKYPAPGGDEPGFVDVAYAVATRGSLSTNVYLGLLPGADHHVYWQPPLYFFTLGGWLRAFGASVASARSFSLIWALASVVLVYLIGRRTVPRAPATAAASLFAVSFWLTNRASSARMDMMCIGLTLGAVFVYLLGRDRESKLLDCLGGFVAGLALTTHPLGIIAIAALLLHEALSARSSTLRSKRTLALLGGFVLALVPWGIYVAQDPATFSAQMARQFERKAQLGSYWHQFWMARTHAVTLLVTGGAGLWALISSSRNRANAVVPVAFAISFVLATLGRETGYFSYFYPFACIAVGSVLAAEKPRRMVLLLVVLAFLNETVILANDIRRYRHRDYNGVSRVVLDVVPAGATVFIAYPEVTPYFALLGRNPMRIAVPTPTEAHAHRDVAFESRWVATTAPLTYLPDVNELLTGLTPVAVVDQGPGYRLELYRLPP